MNDERSPSTRSGSNSPTGVFCDCTGKDRDRKQSGASLSYSPTAEWCVDLKGLPLNFFGVGKSHSEYTNTLQERSPDENFKKAISETSVLSMHGTRKRKSGVENNAWDEDRVDDTITDRSKKYKENYGDCVNVSLDNTIDFRNDALDFMSADREYSKETEDEMSLRVMDSTETEIDDNNKRCQSADDREYQRKRNELDVYPELQRVQQYVRKMEARLRQLDTNEAKEYCGNKFHHINGGTNKQVEQLFSGLGKALRVNDGGIPSLYNGNWAAKDSTISQLVRSLLK